MSDEIIVLQQDCEALMVPSGARIVLRTGTEVRITQALGSSYTVDVYGNLARIEGKDAAALGKAPPDPLAELPEDASIEDKIWVQLKTVYDPEIPVNIVELGLVYNISVSAHVDGGHDIHITMTLTAPGCGMGPVIAEDAKSKIYVIPNTTHVEVEIVFDPPWSRDMMSEAAQLSLGVI